MWAVPSATLGRCLLPQNAPQAHDMSGVAHLRILMPAGHEHCNLVCITASSTPCGPDEDSSSFVDPTLVNALRNIYRQPKRPRMSTGTCVEEVKGSDSLIAYLKIEAFNLGLVPPVNLPNCQSVKAHVQILVVVFDNRRTV